MTSNEEQAAYESSQARSDEAEKLVVEAYGALDSTIKTYLGNGEYSDGKILKEVFHMVTPVPPLLSAEDYVKFRRLTGLFGSESLLAAISSILRSDCDEKRLKPAIANDEKGKAVVILY